MSRIKAQLRISHPTEFHSTEKKQRFLMEISKTNTKLYNRTLIEENKAVHLQKHEFQCREESISQTVMAFIVHQGSNAENELIVFVANTSRKAKSSRLRRR